MGHAIPAQHPPVVLRSRFNKLRALLAIALVCVAGLTVAVVSLAGDDDDVAGKPLHSINYAGEKYVNPSTGYPAETLRPQAGVRANATGTRIDNGPFSPPSGIVSSAGPRAEVPSPGYDGGPVERYEAETKYFVVPSSGYPSGEHRPQVSHPGNDGGPVTRYDAETKLVVPSGR